MQKKLQIKMKQKQRYEFSKISWEILQEMTKYISLNCKGGRSILNLQMNSIFKQNIGCHKFHLIERISNKNLPLQLFYSMTENQTINMEMLRQKIVEGITEIHKSINQKEAVLFVGDTGVGKSTLLSYLIGQQLRIQQVGLKVCLVNPKDQKHTALKIGHDRFSETSVPVKVNHQGLAFYDCPGFNDNKSRQAQIANSFYYQRLMSLYEKTKLVIIIDQSYLTEARAQSLPSLARKLEEAFTTLDKVRFSTLLIINKCDPDSNIEDALRQLSKIITTKDMFSEEQIKYFEFLMKNEQIYSFKHPKRSQIGQYADEKERQKIFSKIQELDYMDQVEIKNIISYMAKLAIRDYLDQITQQSAQKLNALMEKVKNIALHTKTSLYQIKQQIMQLFRYKQNMYQRRDLTPLFNFCVQRKIQCQEVNNLKKELQIVEFFSKVYSKQKTEGYYLNTISLILTNFSLMLHIIDTRIQDQKLEAERKKRKQQRKIEQSKLNDIQKMNKKNSLQPKLAEIIKKLERKVLQENQKINQQKENVKIESLKSNEPAVLSFQRKLQNAEQKVKEISNGITDLYSKASAFTETLDKEQNKQN